MVNCYIWLFSFWDVVSVRDFTSLLSIIDTKTRNLWNFPTASKCPPIHILSYFLAILKKKGVQTIAIWVDEDGAFARSSEFTSFLIHHNVTMETTGCYASWLIGRIERPCHTIANKVRAMLFNFGLNNTLWCYAAEAAEDAYRYTFHSVLKKSSFEAWYGTKPHIDDIHIWGCVIYI